MVGTDVITVAQPPAVNWGPNTVICQGSSITAQAVPQNAAYQYRWLRNGTLVPGQTGSTLSISQTGQYRVEINNGNGCFVASAPQTIEVRNAPLANFGLRVAGPMHLQVTDSSQLADTYLWQFDNGQTATLASPPIQEYATNGLKTIQLSITGCGGQTQVVSRQVLLGFDELRSQAVQWGTHENLQYTGNACLNEARFTQNPQSRHLLAVGSQFATEGTMEWRFWASRGYNASNPNDTTIISLAGNAAGPVS
ncbi:MAG TPA: hypothetical protein PKD90_20330, partial [Phnomibacter sp.]|nr:hypothetical protein [Phnomibacter sp.]